MSQTRLGLGREQILAFRRRVGALDERLPRGRASLRTAARAGLADSMPRAALLSIHARVEGTEPTTWSDPSLVQVWGPRFSAYLIAERDLAVFTLGRLPEDEKGRRRAEDAAALLRTVLAGRRLPYGQAGREAGVNPNSLRYAAPTGTVLIRWDGARQPTVWTVPAPELDPASARRELVRRYLAVLGPGTAEGFGRWAGVRPRQAGATFEALGPSLTPVGTPVGDAWIRSEDEAELRAHARTPAAVRLLPSGDVYYLLHGAERALLVPEASLRERLWTSRVWPGAVLVDGEVVGTWRRGGSMVTVEPWRRLPRTARDAVRAEAHGLPLPAVEGPVEVTWSA